MIRRRQVTTALLTALLGLQVARGSRSLAAAPAGAPRTPLDVNDPTAKAVNYIEDARSVDPRLFPAYRRGQSCTTCNLIEFGTARLRGCSLFPGKLVVAAGWCSVWVPRGSKS